MTAYLVMIGVLSILALIENSHPSSFIGKLSAFLLIIFAGLRYETGFDWMAYELYYETTSPIWSNIPQYIEPSLLVEPGFALFNLFCKSIGLPFQGFLFSITAINILTIYFFTKRYTERVCLVLLVYFGFAFLAAQMAAIRQSLSYSFILIAFIRYDTKKTWSSFVCSITAVSIHTFSLVFVPLIYFRPPRLPLQIVVLIMVFGISMSLYGINFIPLIADNILPILGSNLITTKLELYGGFDGHTISRASLAFIPLHLSVYYLLTTKKPMYTATDTNLTSFTISVTFLILFAHSYFGLFPAFWNRVSYLAFLLQAAALTARYAAYFRDPVVPVAATSFAGAAAAAITIYTLSSPSSLPFTPYQNAAVVWLSGDYGDGRSRYAYAFDQAEREFADQKR